MQDQDSYQSYPPLLHCLFPSGAAVATELAPKIYLGCFRVWYHIGMSMDRRMFLRTTGAAALSAKELLKPSSANAQEGQTRSKDPDPDFDAYDGKEILPSQNEKNKLMFKEFVEHFASVVKNPKQLSYLARTTRAQEIYELMVDDASISNGGIQFCVIRNADSSAITLRGMQGAKQWEYVLSADGSATGSIPDEVNQGIRIVTSKAVPPTVYLGYDFSKTCEVPTS